MLKQKGINTKGFGHIGNAGLGQSVALSSDNNTALVGGPDDNSSAGAVWVHTQVNGTWTQQGNKLVGTGNTGFFGQSVSLSGDGNVAIVGDPENLDSLGGAAWIFTRSGGVWSLQTTLVGTGAVGQGNQGTSVAMSADGNTALVGGFADNCVNGQGCAGAAWVFTQAGGVWTQQAKLVGTGAIGGAAQGSSVALSSDGITAIVGGPHDNVTGGLGIGAVWIFTQNNGVWTQQGSKLVPNDNSLSPQFGSSVAVSANGNIVIVGGPSDNASTGAAWVFARNAGTWSQQAPKIVGADGTPNFSFQGSSVALSADGNTAAIGGPIEGSAGAGWVFKNSGGTWIQQGPKFVGSGATGAAHEGTSIALSADGKTGIMGGSFDDSGAGAWWAFAANNTSGTHDFNGDSYSDILFRNTSSPSSAVAMWLITDGSIASSGTLATLQNTYSIIGQRDFNGDGQHDILWRDTAGNLYMWFMNGTAMSSSASLGNVPLTWTVYGTGDLNGDGIGDILWQDNNGNIGVWFMNGGAVSSTASLGQVPTNWSIVGDDNNGNIYWRDNVGDLAIWQVSGSQVVASTGLGNVPSNWMIAGLADFDGNGLTDILWRDNNSGTVAIWFMELSGANIGWTVNLGAIPSAWNIAQTGDYNGDGYGDILWIDSTGDLAAWFMNAGAVSSTVDYGNVGTSWSVQSLNAE